METTTTKTNETLIDNSKIAEKWFNDTSAAMKEIYSKQLNLTTDFYNNFINSTFGNNGSGNVNHGFGENFFNNNLTKLMLTPLNGLYGNNNASSFFTTFDKTFKQFQESNRNFYSDFYSQIKTKEFDWSSINKEFIESIEKQMESSKKVLDSMSETYSKQLNLSFETEKNMIEEINSQFNSILKQSQKFWSDTLQTYQAPLNGEEKKVKNPNEMKTKTAMTFQ